MLWHQCWDLHHAVVVGIIWQICVLNMGRPAGQALHEFVAAAVDAFMAGFTFDKLSLQLAVNAKCAAAKQPSRPFSTQCYLFPLCFNTFGYFVAHHAHIPKARDSNFLCRFPNCAKNKLRLWCEAMLKPSHNSKTNCDSQADSADYQLTMSNRNQ